MEELKDWNQIFDKSKARKVPVEFPGNANSSNLELEDVNDEVTDEIDEKGTLQLQLPLPVETTSNTASRLVVTKQRNGSLSNGNGSTSFGLQNGIPKDNRTLFKPRDEGRRLSLEKKNPFKHKDEQPKCSCNKKREKEILEAPITKSENNLIQDTIIAKQVKENFEFSGYDSSPIDKRIKDEITLEPKKEMTLEPMKFPTKNEEILQENISENEVNNCRWKGSLITFQTIKELKTLLFGSPSVQFGFEWQRQNICLNRPNHYALRYHKGSTQGVMSCLQAHVLKHVLFDEMPGGNNAKPCEVDAFYKKALIIGMSDILWQAGMNERAVVCLPSANCSNKIKMDFKQDDLTEQLEVFEFTEKKELDTFLTHNISHFAEEERFGCILFIYSVILSRSTERVREDIADANECLIGQMNICSQSLINLLLVGTATSNVFNSTKEIIDQCGNSTVLYGVRKRSDIGYLTSEEVQDPKRYTVGSMLKTPMFPIWVASYDDHFCVLFCKKRNLLCDWKLERRFDLYHFGGVLRHFSLLKADIKLTIDTMRPFDPNDYDDEIKSSLEETIRTKWQDCHIDWNESHRF